MHNENTINIVFAADDNYAQHTAVAMTSILLNAVNKDDIVFYLLSDGISQEKAEKIQETVQSLGSQLYFIEINGSSLQNYYVSGQLSRAAYCRLDMAAWLPQYVHKVIYMDCDLLVHDDIQQLWELRMNNYPLAAAVDLGIMASSRSRHQKAKQIHLGMDEPYFNSGVLIFDLDQWREQAYGEQVKKLAQENEYVHHDQDALNVLFKDNWQEIPLRWNVIPPVFNLFLKIVTQSAYRKKAITARKNMAVMHYAGGYKPWEYSIHPGFNEYYYECLSHTAFADATMPQLDRRRKHRSIGRQMLRLYLGNIWEKIFDR